METQEEKNCNITKSDDAGCLRSALYLDIIQDFLEFACKQDARLAVIKGTGHYFTFTGMKYQLIEEIKHNQYVYINDSKFDLYKYWDNKDELHVLVEQAISQEFYGQDGNYYYKIYTKYYNQFLSEYPQ